MIKVENIKKKYDSFTLDCSLEVKPGYITGIIGQNGAGKSTLFKAIIGLISLDDGNISVFDKDIHSFNNDDKEKLGIVLSDSMFSGYLTINDIIPILDNLYKHFEKSFFIHTIERFQLPFNKSIRDFSTGMKAKLKMIIAISHQAKILILDEPTAGLDVIARDELLLMLREYMEKNDQCSILISSHISSDLENLCDNIYMIDNGKIILHEDINHLLDDYALLKLNDQQFNNIDKNYILKYKKEDFGYSCLTNERQYYSENYPSIVIEKINIDDIITIMIRGE